MGKSDSKKAKAQAEADAAKYRAELSAATTQAKTPTPVESLLSKEQLGFLNASAGKSDTGESQPFDIRDPRLGLAPHLALYNSALANQDPIAGTGAIQMGQTGSNPNLVALLHEQRMGRQQQAAAGGLENAYSAKNAQVRGDIPGMLGLNQQRNSTMLGAMSGLYGNAQNSVNQFAAQPSFWSQLALAGVGAAGSALSGSKLMGA